MDKHVESQNEKDNQEHALLISSNEDSDIELSPQTQSLRKTRYMTGLALLGLMIFAVVSIKAGPTLLHGGLENTVQLDGESSASKFYLVKQTFKSDKDVKHFWEAWNNMDKEVTNHFEKGGYHIPICAMLAEKGPFFHVLEQKAGNSNDAQNYFDNWMKKALKVDMVNEMKPLAFPPVKPFFAARSGKERLLKSSKSSKSRRSSKSFYLVEMTSSWVGAKEYAHEFDKAGGFKQWNKDAEKEGGCHDHMCLAVEGGGLTYELMEAKAGVKDKDIKDFVNKWTDDNLKMGVGIRVFPIPESLNGDGFANIGVKPYFK